jgi:phenylalanyl-tRNA synthetase beta chain
LRVSYNWLREFVHFEEKPEKVAELLTMSGLEVSEVATSGDDFALEVEITSNRPDCLSIVGVAREISTLSGIPLQLPQFSLPTGEKKAAELTSVEILARKLCPRYTAQIITGVKVGESPAWLKERLETTGVRPVNNVVDATNYIAMESGQPLHAFNFDALQGRKIIVRRAKKNETIRAIDGKVYALKENDLVIADSQNAVAIAGVIGGLDSEVTFATQNILLESAFFDPLSVRKTSRALTLTTSASYRFERGVDPQAVLTASLRAAYLIRELTGAVVAQEPIDVNYMKVKDWRVPVRFARFKTVMGFDVSPDRAEAILNLLGLQTLKRTKRSLTVSVPPRRKDLEREIDLIEEVARIEGFEKVPLVEVNAAAVRCDKRLELLCEIRQILRGFGFHEILTESFVRDSSTGKFSLFGDSENLRVMNPIRPETPLLRKSLIPNILATYVKNQDEKVTGINLFEISNVYLPREDVLPEEVYFLSFVSEGSFSEAKGVVESVLGRFGLLEKVRFQSGKFHITREGESAEILLEGKRIGLVGVVSPHVKEASGIKIDVALCELLLTPILFVVGAERKYAPLPNYPKVLRDLAIVIDESVKWDQIESAVTALGIPILESVQFFDLYSGKQVPEGKKSIAFSLQFASPERTLTGEEVNAAQETIINHLRNSFGADLRK